MTKRGQFRSLVLTKLFYFIFKEISSITIFSSMIYYRQETYKQSLGISVVISKTNMQNRRENDDRA